MDRKSIYALILLIGIFGIFIFVWFYSEKYITEGSSIYSTSRIGPLNNKIKDLYEELKNKEYGTESSVLATDWGSILNRIRSSALWNPYGTATNEDVLSGKSFYSQDGRQKQEGTIPIKTGTNSSTNQSSNSQGISLTVPKGYYDGESKVSATNQEVANLDSDIKAENILTGKNIFGVEGSIPIKSGDTASILQATAGGLIYLTTEYGYYTNTDRISATNAQISALSPDLVSGNLLSGVSIFGVSGSIPIKSGDNASTSQATVGGLIYLTAPTGYYDGDDRVFATNAQIVALDPNLAAGNILTGVSIFGVTGTYPNPTNCATQLYYYSHVPPATEETNCSLTWGAPTTPVTGDDNRAGRGPKDPRTGLVWSKYLKNNAGVVEFADSGGVLWSWDATGANNIAVGGKTASQLCSERGNGWRLPTQIELMQAYIDGSYWNLTNSTVWGPWSATEASDTSAWVIVLSNGNVGTSNKPNLNYVRCVR